MIVGVCGFINSGKDTVADYLVKYHNFRHDSFAANLKDVVASVFGWDRKLLSGSTRDSRIWREKVDPWWAERLGIPNLTPRLVLQLWGTEVCRKGFHNDIWIASLENKLRNSLDNTVISDCRFPNEIASIKRAGGKVIWVQRGPLPEWYDHALNYNAGQQRIGWAIGKHYLDSLNIHSSEYAWIGSDFDHVISNNGSFTDLYGQVKNLVLKDLDAMVA